MKFDLHFKHSLSQSALYTQHYAKLKLLFPFSQLIRYYNKSPRILIRRLHYSRKSIQIDYYKTKNPPFYRLNISINTSACIFIILHEGELCYANPLNIDQQILLKSNQCIFLRVKPGKYFASLNQSLNKYHVISLTQDLLYPLREGFDELIDFMDSQELTSKLSAMEILNMDQAFLSQLKLILNYKKNNYKDFNRYLLWQIPKLLSAYKGLLKNKDRPFQDKQLFQQILNYIEDRLNKHQPLNIKNILQDHPIAENKLYKIFSIHIGCTPSRYIQEKKILQIAKVLKTTRQPLLSIALSFGYSDSNSLNKSFKKIMGLTPYQYRNTK